MASKRKKKNNHKRHYLKRDRERKNLARRFNKNYLQECENLIKALKTVAEASKWDFQRAAENIRNSKEEAEKVNHISPKLVADCPNISTEITRISSILSRAEKIVGYNTPFDLDFLRAAGVQIPESVEIADVMQMFAEIKDAKATLHCYKNIIGKNIGKTKQL